MKKMLFGLLALVSLSAMAKPCDLDVIESIMVGEVGVKFKQVAKKTQAAQEAGNQALFEKKREQGAKMLAQVVDLAATACEK